MWAQILLLFYSFIKKSFVASVFPRDASPSSIWQLKPTKNKQINVSQLYKISLLTDSNALNLWKVRSGFLKLRNKELCLDKPFNSLLPDQICRHQTVHQRILFTSKNMVCAFWCSKKRSVGLVCGLVKFGLWRTWLIMVITTTRRCLNGILLTIWGHFKHGTIPFCNLESIIWMEYKPKQK